MPKTCTLFCLVHIKKCSFLTSCVFWCLCVRVCLCDSRETELYYTMRRKEGVRGEGGMHQEQINIWIKRINTTTPPSLQNKFYPAAVNGCLNQFHPARWPYLGKLGKTNTPFSPQPYRARLRHFLCQEAQQKMS